MRRHCKIAIALGLTALLGVTGCAQPVQTTGDGGRESVRVTIYPGTMPSLGVYVADALGYFKDEGLDVEYVNVASGSSSLQLLAAGQTDLALAGVEAAAAARAKGSPIVFVSGQVKRFPASLVCQKDVPVATKAYPAVMHSLVGRSIGITAPGSATDYYTQFSLIDAGVNRSDVKIVPIGGAPQLVAAFESRHVDCIVAYQPMQLQMTNGQTLVNWQSGEGPAEFRDYIANGVATTEGFASQHSSAVEKFTAALKKAIEDINNPANAEKIAEATLQFFPGFDLKSHTTTVKSLAGTFSADLTKSQIAGVGTIYEAVTGSPLGSSYGELAAKSAQR